MDVSEQGSNGIHGAEPNDEESLSSYLPEVSLPKFGDMYEDSVLFPRVGEQYQVEIPPMATKSEVFHLKSISHDVADMSPSDRFGLGLEISIKWIQYAGDSVSIKCEKEDLSDVAYFPGMTTHLHNNKSTQVDHKFNIPVSAPENPNLTGKFLQRSTCKTEFLDSSFHNNLFSYLSNHELRDSQQMDYFPSLPIRRKAGGFYPLPGSPTLSLNDFEKQSFLLGLYIFGKDLVLVKKFMESSRMGALLSFYYGKFYSSDAYHRWSEFMKTRSRRPIHGQRMFTGWRQQELLSRLLNTTSKELQDTLLEAVKAFNEGRAAAKAFNESRAVFVEFVFRLKAAVGLLVLIEAIGIGKGAYDLTVLALDHVRTNQPIPLNSEIPVGRACSSLTSLDIIKFLTGDFRLSKARSNDLFWEAVWPRLLARGWHSEQPKDRGSLSFKNALVFLVPGIKKFSKKKLVKGTHFFDSVTDVLSKVASDPRLLEFDGERAKDYISNKEENGRDLDSKVYKNSSSNYQRPCYMHPRLPNCNSVGMKFTVVDTSLVRREGPFKVMELRSLPMDYPSSYAHSADPEESGGENSSELQESSTSSADEEGSNPASFGEKKPEVNRSTHSEQSKTSKPLPAMTNGYAPSYKGLVERKDDKTVEIRYQNNRRVQSSQRNHSAPTLKRRKLTNCTREYDPHAFDEIIQQNKKQLHLKPIPIKAAATLNPDTGPFQEKTNLFPHVNRPENNIVGRERIPRHKLESQNLIDLNNLPPDVDLTESTSNEFKTEDLRRSPRGKQTVGNQVPVRHYNDLPLDEQPSTGLRRQSTRNRPPTAKALEALASGLLGTKRAWRSSTSLNRPSRKAQKAYEEPLSSTAPDPGNVASSTLSMTLAETVNKDYEKSARKGTHELLGTLA